MAILMKNGIAYAKSDKIYTRVFEKELLGGQSTVIFTDELIVPDSTIKFYSSDKDMVLISKKITGHTLKAVVYSTKITHNVKVEISTPHSSINPICYGYRMNNSINNPDNCITYLEDAEGMTPAAMNFSTGVFNYGSWENTFFMPKPCMLNYDGTVAYYLDKNDYSKKEDGTPSDVSNVNFPGNAMMEWGQNGQKIWYKIVPDDSNNGKSANIYIANMKLDNHFEAWPFYDVKGHLTNHFYTAIYGASVDSSGKIRSLSGQDRETYMDPADSIDREHHIAWPYEKKIERAQLNNAPGVDAWHLEQYCDNILITLLTVLITKSNDVQNKIGKGLVETSITTTGALNDKGMFYGANVYTSGIKIFGMEDWYGNGLHMAVGIFNHDSKVYYKLTRSTRDGSNCTDYPIDKVTDFISGPNYMRDSNWGKNINEITYTRYNFFPSSQAYVDNGRYAGDNFNCDKPEITNGVIIGRGAWSVQYGVQCGLFQVQTKPQSLDPNEQGCSNWCTHISCKPERK